MGILNIGGTLGGVWMEETSKAGKENEQEGKASSSNWMYGWMDGADNSTQWDGLGLAGSHGHK